MRHDHNVAIAEPKVANQDIRESYYQIADNLRPLVDALEKADAELGPDGPLLEEHYLFCEILDRLKKSYLGGVV